MRTPARGTDSDELFLKINADRLRTNGVDVSAILGRPVGSVASVTENEMDAIGAVIKLRARTRPMMDVVEYVS